MKQISESLRDLRYEILLSDPEALDGRDIEAIGRELNKYRQVLGRLYAIHRQNSDGGWGGFFVNDIAQAAARLRATQEPDPAIPEDDEEDPPKKPAPRSRRGTSS